MGAWTMESKNVKQYKTKISPKADFLSDPARAGRHQDVVMNPEFKQAVQIAFAEYAVQVSGIDTTPQQVTVGLKLDGARAVLNELLNLGIPSLPDYKPNHDNLDTP